MQIDIQLMMRSYLNSFAGWDNIGVIRNRSAFITYRMLKYRYFPDNSLFLISRADRSWRGCQGNGTADRKPDGTGRSQEGVAGCTSAATQRTACAKASGKHHLFCSWCQKRWGRLFYHNRNHTKSRGNPASGHYGKRNHHTSKWYLWDWEHYSGCCPILTANARHTPLVGVIVIAQAECPLCAVKGCRTDKVCPKQSPFLVCWKNPVNMNRDELPIPVTETEPHRGDFSICISTWNHLHRGIDTQDCFHHCCLHISKIRIFIYYCGFCRKYNVMKRIIFIKRML